MRRSPALLVALAIASALLVPAAVAPAYRSTSKAAPDYPGSSLRLEVRGKPRVRSIVTLRVSGRNAPRQITQNSWAQYTLDVFAQVRSTYPSCGASLSAARQRVINLPDQAAQIANSIPMGDGRQPFSTTLKFRAGTSRKILLCAYSRYAIDDMAVGALKHDLRRARRR